MGATVNGLRALSVRLVVPSRGVWLADIDLDPEIASTPIIGPVTILIGTSPMLGTVDPRGSGRFVASRKLRVLGGGGGWDKPVPRQAFHNDAGIISQVFYSATATIVGEVVVDATPQNLGVDFYRFAAAASRIFRDREWFVDFHGITQVLSRIPVPQDPSLEVLEYDPETQTVEVACDVPIVPGTLLIDTATTPRWDGSLSVVDVEQTFDKIGSRAILFCSSTSATRLLSALTNLVRETSERELLRFYRYRVVLQGPDNRLQLQAVTAGLGAPDALPLPLLAGTTGDSAKFKPSTEVLVVFEEGDPTRPRVLAADSTVIPLERTVDASVATHIGPSSPSVDIAGGTTPVVPTPWASGLATALAAFASAAAGVPGMAAACSALTSALGALPSPATLKTKAA